MPRLSWTPAARGDLRTINSWLTREATPAVALRVTRAIRARADDLKQFPRIGRRHGSGARILRVLQTPYLIRYRVKEGSIEIIRVHHERENWHVEP